MSIEGDGSGDYAYTTSTISNTFSNYSYAFWAKSPSAAANVDGYKIPFSYECASCSIAFLWTGDEPGGSTDVLQYKSHQHEKSVGGYNRIQVSGNLNAGTWYHIAVTFDGTTIKLYLDGSLNASGAGAAQNLASNGKIVLFAADAAGDYKWDGELAEVGMWDSALTAGNITSLFNGDPIRDIAAASQKFALPGVQTPGDLKGNAITTVGSLAATSHPPGVQTDFSDSLSLDIDVTDTAQPIATGYVISNVGITAGTWPTIHKAVEFDLELEAAIVVSRVYALVSTNLSFSSKFKARSPYLASGRHKLKAGG